MRMIVTMIGLLAPPLEAAAQSAPPPAPPPIDCRDADHKGFDFMIGDWTVTDTRSGRAIARSRIELIQNGCALRETFDQTVGPGGQAIDYHGTSYSAFNAADRTWRQFYVDTAGTASSYVGGLEDGAMVLVAGNPAVRIRMTLRLQADGTVRQSGEASRDAGVTWTPGYDFTYRPAPASPASRGAAA